MKFDEIFRKNVTHYNIHKKSQKVRASPSLSKIKFWKDQRGGRVKLILLSFIRVKLSGCFCVW